MSAVELEKRGYRASTFFRMLACSKRASSIAKNIVSSNSQVFRAESSRMMLQPRATMTRANKDILDVGGFVCLEKVRYRKVGEGDRHEPGESCCVLFRRCGEKAIWNEQADFNELPVA